ncbi:unnamed protein product [Effrenium voratum]|uniref:Uncharacterized protein n=1 Tax=Effrenium voratum TaxID=2562239 RepID=A0AA36ISH2_9DINO|nr:unnamed protein product [Effrenium voratum]CAJ1393165.1 unnamed protein product [Effrenium voratum]CAJ1447055.1 unnamed protein product [Effrenium voratum]
MGLDAPVPQGLVLVAIWFLWAVPFQLLAQFLTDHFDLVSVADGWTKGWLAPPEHWWGVTQSTRVVTTVSDVLVTVVMFAMAWFYQRAVTSKRGTANDLGFSRPLLELPGEGCSSANSDRHLCCLYFWASAVTPIRVADNFRAANVLSFWTPLWVYLLSRVAALAIGLVPGMLGGIPSLSTQLAQGLFFALRRPQLIQSVEEMQSSLGEESHLEDRSQDVGRNLVTYSFLCCWMAVADAEVVDSVERLRLEGCQAVVGRPVRTKE